MFQYLNILKYNLRFNLLPHILAAIGLLILAPILFGITALDTMASAYPLELYIPFIGVILLAPVYSPEQESSILDTIRVRKMPYLLICSIRIIIAVAIIMIFICGFVLMMAALECEVSIIHVLDSFTNAIFLGGLGILASSISGHVISGYIFPLLYYIIDLMGAFGHFTMFSMMRSGTIDGKWVTFVIGLCCIGASILCWYLRIWRR